MCSDIGSVLPAVSANSNVPNMTALLQELHTKPSPYIPAPSTRERGVGCLRESFEEPECNNSNLKRRGPYFRFFSTQVANSSMNTPRTNRQPLADITPTNEIQTPTSSRYFIGSKRAIQSPYIRPSPSTAPSKRRAVNFNEEEERAAVKKLWTDVSSPKPDSELLAYRLQKFQEIIDFANLENRVFKSN